MASKRIIISDAKEPEVNAGTFDFSGFSNPMKDNKDTLIETVPEVVADDQPKKRGRKPGVKNKPKEPETVTLDNVMSGSLFLTLINSVIPAIITFINNKVAPKSKIDAKDLRLTDDDMKDLQPLADKVVQSMEVNANPSVLLAISLIGIYGMKFMMVKSN